MNSFLRWSLFFPGFRKGIPCHASILNGLLEGMEIGDADKIIFVDLLPNRPAHMSQILFSVRSAIETTLFAH